MGNIVKENSVFLFGNTIFENGFLGFLITFLITIVIAVLGTLICAAIVRIFTPLRVSEKEEKVGLDISQHGENAYPSFNGLD